MDTIEAPRVKRAAAIGTASLAIGVAIVLLLSPASTSAACDASTYTVNGVFDLQGYLACQASEAGGLPATGSQTLQIAGIALAFLVVGLAAILVTRRHRPSSV